MESWISICEDITQVAPTRIFCNHRHNDSYSGGRNVNMRLYSNTADNFALAFPSPLNGIIFVSQTQREKQGMGCAHTPPP